MATNDPVAFCSLHHGASLFPDLVRALPDHRTLYAMTRKHLCGAVAATGLRCDPGRCHARLARAVLPVLNSDHPAGTWGYHLKTAFQEEYAAPLVAGSGTPATVWTDHLAELRDW